MKADYGDNCITNVSKNDCSNCEKGFKLVTKDNNKVCISLQDPECELWEGYNCSRCNRGTSFFPDPSKPNKTCTPIVAADIIDNCLYYKNKDTCKQCDENFYLSVDGKSCKNVNATWDNKCNHQI